MEDLKAVGLLLTILFIVLYVDMLATASSSSRPAVILRVYVII